MKLLQLLGIVLLAVAAAGTAVAQSQWTPVQNVPNISAGAIALLTDGRVLVHDDFGVPQNWYILTPDINGHYETGTWSQAASFPSSYGPVYFGSAVLQDGRYIVEGGEYNNGNPNRGTVGMIYDPTHNTWTNVSPPSGWHNIGDSPSVILFNGNYIQSSCCDNPPKAAILDPVHLTWTSTGSNKFDIYDEEGLTLLPGGNVLDVDAYVEDYQANGKNYEIYNASTGNWSVAGTTPVQLWDSCGGAGGASYELGPAVLMPNGTVYQAGANGCGAGHNASYNTATGTWTAGPDFPSNLDTADAPAALETNGKVIVMTSPGVFGTGAVFFEWDGTHLNQISGPPNGPGDSSYYGHFLMLPTGQLMFTDFSNDVELFNSTGSNYTGWQPSVLLNHTVYTHGTTIVLQGFKFNGVSQNNAYGDDFQDATNYPLVRLTNQSTGHVFYARTHDHSAMPVSYTGPTFTHVDIPSSMETGATTLQVVVNGIASQGYTIGIN